MYLYAQLSTSMYVHVCMVVHVCARGGSACVSPTCVSRVNNAACAVCEHNHLSSILGSNCDYSI